ncbi:MAG: carbon monoxide dehydrogenase subunit G [Pseudomonadota bacterium]|nr:carbon monoxide dehydrogenase subunit G [Pseudomonadota bacterium]
MELHGDRLIPATVATTWAALNDPEVLKACIAGCESLERIGDDAYVAVVAMKIGPVSARFRGNLKMTNVDAPNGYTIAFDGQGGVAGFGKGSADVKLLAEGEAATRLAYEARAQVGGKMAQIGSRLIDATAAKITDDFFKAFEAHLQAQQAPAPGGPGHPGAGPAPVTAAASARRAHQPAGMLGWGLAATVLLAMLYLVFR